MVQNRQKVNVNPFTFLRGPFFKVNFFENCTSNEAQAKNAFNGLKKLFQPYITSQKWSKIVQTSYPGYTFQNILIFRIP